MEERLMEAENQGMEIRVKRLTLTAVLTAVSIVGSTLSFPAFGAKCAPVQHLVNVLCAVLLGPGYGVMAAFMASLIRNILGLGSLLAFPGSICGALLSALLYRRFRVLPAALIGELVGTGLLGGLLAYPVAALFMGNSRAAIFSFIIPFFVSTAGGTAIAAVVLPILKRSGVLHLS